jgi:predicted alpha/beta superfamily hydrolase
VLSSNILPNKAVEFTLLMPPLLPTNHTSVSFTYAKKKAIHLALKQAVLFLHNELINSPMHSIAQATFLSNKKVQKNEARQKKVALWEARQEKKKTDKLLLKEEEKKRQLELDRKRRKNKQTVKEKTSKKGKDTIYRKYTEEELNAMSVSKRRNLQDRGII